jgi:uncharacterized protein (TIGR02001 family)
MRRGIIISALVAAATGHAQAEEATAFVGATLTSNYLYDGLTQTDDGPAVQPYLEVEFPPGLYVGAWGSNVDFGDDTDSIEIDLYVGFRGETEWFGYDLTYLRYYYDETGYCCGEFKAEVDFPIYGPVSGLVGYNSYLNGNYALSAGLDIALPQEFTLSGVYKSDGIEHTWNVGVSKYLTETLRADLRYYDASYVDDPTTVVSLNWDTDWESLFGGE